MVKVVDRERKKGNERMDRSRRSTDLDFENRNGQIVVRRTSKSGTDHN